MSGTELGYAATRMLHSSRRRASLVPPRPLSPYALATRCAVLRSAKLLRDVRKTTSWYTSRACTGTALAYAAISLRAGMLLRDVRY
eukprot:3153537-Rhodomonas_salina.1